MGTTYLDALKRDKKYVGNVVVRFLGRYFTLREPDAGLITRDKYQNTVSSLVVNPTTVDPKRVSTTIASYSVKLEDRDGVISRLVKGNGADLNNQDVEIWIGRNLKPLGGVMDFSDYYKMPVTRIKKISFVDNAYTFSTTEETERINKPIYDIRTRLSGAILPGTTTLTVKDDISEFPAGGFLRISSEIMGYASKDDATRTFEGVTRGEFNTTPVEQEENADMYLAEVVEANPLDILLRLLISGGGGGLYDTLTDGLGISPSLIDLEEIEALRNEIFPDYKFRLALSNVDSALSLIESEILSPLNLRFTYSRNSKLTLALLDKARFVEAPDVINEDTLAKNPSLTIEDSKIVNVVEIDWGFNEDTEKFENRSVFFDQESIDKYGEKAALKFKFKGLKSELDGDRIVSLFGKALLSRLSTPTPEVSVTTHIDRSLLNVGDKSLVVSSKLSNFSGGLNFAEEMEIVSRAINHQTGDVQLKLAFTSFTGVRTCYLAPASTFISAESNSVGTLGAGVGDAWSPGWRVRLGDTLTGGYATEQVNEIASIEGDKITFVEPWDVTLNEFKRLKFPDFDDATPEQKRYCYISPAGVDFSTKEKSYKIVP